MSLSESAVLGRLEGSKRLLIITNGDRIAMEHIIISMAISRRLFFIF